MDAPPPRKTQVRRSWRLLLPAALLSVVATAPRATADPLALTLANVPDGPSVNAITLRVPVDTDTTSMPLFIRQDSESRLEGIELRVTPLADADGTISGGEIAVVAGENGSAVSAGEKGPTVSVPPKGDELEVELQVENVDALGTFTSTLYARKDATDQTLATVTLTRSRQTGVLTVADLAAVSTTRWPWESSSVNMLVTVTNTSSRSVTLQEPVLSQLAVGGTAKFQAHDAHAFLGTCGGAPRSVALPPGDPKTVSVCIWGLRDTGGYSGNLIIGAAGVEPVTETIVIDAKETVILPIILILVGVVISYFLRTRLGAGRTRLVQQRRDRQLAQDIDAARKENPDLTTEEKEILISLERLLQRLYDDLDTGDVADADDRLAEVDKKLDLFPQFLAARRLIETAQPESLRPPFRQTLNVVALDYFKKQKPDDASRTAAAEKLSKIPEDLAAAVKAELLKQIDAFQTVASARSSDLPRVTTEVIPAIEAAKAAAESNAATAAEHLEQAQRTFSQILCNDFLARLPAEGQPPLGFDDQAWATYRRQVVTEIRDASDAANGRQGLSRFNSTWTAYRLRLSHELQRQASEEREAVDDSRRAALDTAIAKAQEAAAAAASGHAADADAAYQAAVAAYPRDSGGRMDETAETRSVRLPPQPVIVPATAALGGTESAASRVSRVPASASELTRRLKRNQRWLFAIVAVAATLLGVSFLWGTTDTWGGLNAYAAAFLWGLGLHQVAGATFDVTSFSKALSEGGSAGSTG